MIVYFKSNNINHRSFQVLLGVWLPTILGTLFEGNPHAIIEEYQGRVVQSWVKITLVSAKFEIRHECLKSKFSLIPSVNKLMIGCS